MADESTQKNVLERFLTDGKMALDESQTNYAKAILAELSTQILNKEIQPSKHSAAMIVDRIATIDELLTAQLNEIMHAPEFQSLESSWRGLFYLVSNTETSEMLKLRVFNTTRLELQNDLDKAVEFDQSALFKKVYEEEYGTFGGHPFSTLVYDHEFSRHPQDMALIEKLASIAAAAHTPLLSSASPKLFDMESFTELSGPRDLAKIFESAELIKWRSFRDSEDSRYVSLMMPHILLRLPYGPDTLPVEEFNFVEDVDGKDHSKYLWGNAAWAMAQRITTAFALYQWTAAIRGVETGGLVEGLPVHTFTTDDGDMEVKCPTEIAITDRREKELSNLGFIPLVYCKGSDYAAFFGGQTTNKPKIYNLDTANANARLSSVLPYLLNASRFAHYIKSIMRDKIGGFMTAEDVQRFLNTWIADYILLSDNAGQNLKAQYPLREAQIDVVEVPGKPGSYTATIFLRPHFQLEELTASIRLVAALPKPASDY